MAMMRFTRADLAGVLKRVSSAVNSSTLEIMTHILVDVADGKVRLTANDTSMQITGEAKVESDGPMRFTLPAKRFLALVSSFPPGDEVRLEFDGRRATLRHGRGRYALDCLNADDYVLRKKAASSDVIRVLASDLREALGFCAPSMARNDVRFFLNGAYIEFGDDGLTVVSTDGHRMASARVKAATPQAKGGVILPNYTARELHSMLGDFTGEVILSVGSGSCRIDVGEYEINSALLDATYPDWRRAIVSDVDTVGVDVQPVVSSLKRMALFSNREDHAGVRLSFAGGSLRLNTLNSEADETVEVDGEMNHVAGFNTQYLIDAMSVWTSEQVEVGIRTKDGAQAAMRVRIAGDDSRVVVLMPMKL